MITYKYQFISFFCNLGRIGQVLMFSKRPNLLTRDDYFFCKGTKISGLATILDLKNISTNIRNLIKFSNSTRIPTLNICSTATLRASQSLVKRCL